MKKFMKTATLIMLAALACPVNAVAESVVSPDGGLSRLCYRSPTVARHLLPSAIMVP